MPAQSENEGGQRKKALDERAVQAIDDLLRARATSGASDQRPVSEIVNEALRLVLREDQEDLAAFDEPAAEPTLTSALRGAAERPEGLRQRGTSGGILL